MHDNQQSDFSQASAHKALRADKPATNNKQPLGALRAVTSNQ
jgi:hypothetical protein